jgi:hypothetical protein
MITVHHLVNNPESFQLLYIVIVLLGALGGLGG